MIGWTIVVGCTGNQVLGRSPICALGIPELGSFTLKVPNGNRVKALGFKPPVGWTLVWPNYNGSMENGYHTSCVIMIPHHFIY